MIRLDRQEEIEEKKDFTYEVLIQESRDLLKQSNDLVYEHQKFKSEIEGKYDPHWVVEVQDDLKALKKYKRRKYNFGRRYNDKWKKDHRTELEKYKKTGERLEGIKRYLNEKEFIETFPINQELNDYLNEIEELEKTSKDLQWVTKKRAIKEKEIEAYLENEKLKRVKIRREQDAIAKAKIDEFTSKGVNGHLLEFCKKFEKKMYHCPECKDLLLDQQLLERRAEIEVQMKQLRVSLEPFKEVFLGMNELYCPTCNEVIPRQSIINMVKIEENRSLIAKIIEKLEELSKNSKI